jgi:hypothetical protein
VLVTLGLVLGGCTQQVSLPEMLNLREVTSCLYYEGYGGPYVALHGITATGGATIEQCQRIRETSP